MGAHGLPAASASPAPGCNARRSSPRRGGAVDVRRSSGAARSRRLHSGSRPRLRLPAASRRLGYQCPSGAWPPGRWQRVAVPDGHERRTRQGHRSAAPPTGGRCPGERGADGAGSACVHGSLASLRKVPGQAAVRVASGELSGVRRSAAPRPTLRRHRPAMPRSYPRLAARPGRSGVGRARRCGVARPPPGTTTMA